MCDNPVNQLNNNDRTKEIKNGISRLVKLVEQEKPKYIIVCKKGNLIDEIIHSDIMNEYVINKNIFFLPFPACGRQSEFRLQMKNILSEVDFKNL